MFAQKKSSKGASPSVQLANTAVEASLLVTALQAQDTPDNSLFSYQIGDLLEEEEVTSRTVTLGEAPGEASRHSTTPESRHWLTGPRRRRNKGHIPPLKEPIASRC
ncbi:hypothetical protein C2845_PM14G11320 [Panicum miliaceum]|uniref:Uncharacterized protein n=1 Tax=Panicum miliaceum TaxID=4540 RepID=A0A3L6PMG8_PANMI|nr:hypothetical protein C2845_PM14G11320 [Panicum miliaceum]